MEELIDRIVRSALKLLSLKPRLYVSTLLVLGSKGKTEYEELVASLRENRVCTACPNIATVLYHLVLLDIVEEDNGSYSLTVYGRELFNVLETIIGEVSGFVKNVSERDISRDDVLFLLSLPTANIIGVAEFLDTEYRELALYIHLFVSTLVSVGIVEAIRLRPSLRLVLTSIE